jgi:hypothetical protein
MYDCVHCGKTIAVTVQDPVVVTRLGKLHFRCMRLAMQDSDEPRPRKRRQVEEELPDLLPENGFEKIGPPGGSEEEE